MKPEDPKPEEEAKGDEVSQLNSPKLDEEGKPTKQAISSFKQAHGIAKRQYDKAKDGRFKNDAIIADKYGGSAPFRNADLRSIGEDWRNNFGTNPLASVVDRSTPQLTDPLKQAEYLTYSALPAEREDAANKTRKFRMRLTKLVRSWPGFVSLIYQTAQDTYLYGNAAPAWIDDDWRPKAFRRDETFFPEGTGQHASGVQFKVLRQPILLHDFLQKMEDKEVAIDAGYDWEGCIKAVNEATGLRGVGDISQLEQVDAVREGGTLGHTYDGETKIVWVFHVLVREYDGGVNMWTVAQKGAHPIRFVKDIHESMEDATTLFTLQEGNSKFYGSKGAGRSLCNVHIALDRHRNLGMDKVYMDGMVIIHCKGKDHNSVQMAVRSPFLVVTGDAEISKEQVSFNPESHDYQDKKLSGLMEAIAGAFVPPNLDNQGSSNTKIEAAQKAERELAVKNGVLGRWFGQFANMMGAIQRKVFKPENLREAMRIYEENKTKKANGLQIISAKILKWLKDIVPGMEKTSAPEEQSKVADADAVQCIVDLLTDGLSIEEITELALSPAGNNVEEQPEEQDKKTTDFIAMAQTLPMFSQFNVREMAKMFGEIAMGEDRTNQLLLPDGQDPNIEAVATRDQIQEWIAMNQGEDQPVASTDNHGIHRKVLIPKLQPIIQALQTGPTQEMSELGKRLVQHYGRHLAADQNTTEENKAKEGESVKQWVDIIMVADRQLESMAKKAQEAGIQGGAGAIPQGLPGQPMQNPGANGQMEDPSHLEREKLQAETILRGEDQKIAHRKLNIEQKKLDMQEQQHGVDLATSTFKSIADQSAQAHQSGIQDANAEEIRKQEIEAQAAMKPPAK